MVSTKKTPIEDTKKEMRKESKQNQRIKPYKKIFLKNQ